MLNKALTTFSLIVTSLAIPAQDPLLTYEGDRGPGKGKHIVFIASDHEYRSEEALPALARILAKHHGFKCTVLFGVDQDGVIKPGQSNVPGLETLREADLMVLFARFQNWPDEQMQHFVDYLDRAGPIVGLRTSTHAFKIPRDATFARYSNGYPNAEYKDGFGRQVLGEKWAGHHGKNHRQSTRLDIVPEKAGHPILRGVEKMWVQCGGYKADPLPPSEVLAIAVPLSGMEPDSKTDLTHDAVPGAWTRNYTGKDRPTYEARSDWMSLPGALEKMGNAHGDVAVSSKGDVYVSILSGPKAGIQVYGADGKYRHNLKAAPADLHGFVIHKGSGGEFIYGPCLSGQKIVKIALDGEVVMTIPGKAIPEQYWTLPRPTWARPALRMTACDVAPNGDIYVTDGYGSDHVHRFSAEGKYLTTFGGKKAPYDFRTLHKIAIDTRFSPPRIIGTDRANHRVVHMSLDGKFLGTVAEGLLLPAAVAIHGDHAAVGELKGRVTLLDKAGKVVARVGVNKAGDEVGTNRTPPGKWRPGIVTAPHGVAFNANGDLFVTEYSQYGRVHRFRRTAPNASSGRVFTSTYGASNDIENEGYRRMLINACFWAVGLEAEIKAEADVSFVGPFTGTWRKGRGRRKAGTKPQDMAGWGTPIPPLGEGKNDPQAEKKGARRKNKRE